MTHLHADMARARHEEMRLDAADLRIARSVRALSRRTRRAARQAEHTARGRRPAA